MPRLRRGGSVGRLTPRQKRRNRARNSENENEETQTETGQQVDLHSPPRPRSRLPRPKRPCREQTENVQLRREPTMDLTNLPHRNETDNVQPLGELHSAPGQIHDGDQNRPLQINANLPEALQYDVNNFTQKLNVGQLTRFLDLESRPKP